MSSWGLPLSPYDGQETGPSKWASPSSAVPLPRVASLFPKDPELPSQTPTWSVAVDLTPGWLAGPIILQKSLKLAILPLRASWCDTVSSGTGGTPVCPHIKVMCEASVLGRLTACYREQQTRKTKETIP